MKIKILHKELFPMAQVILQPKEAFNADSAALVGMSVGVQIETKLRSGQIQSFMGKAPGNDVSFINTYRAVEPDSEILLSPGLPGDVVARRLGDGANKAGVVLVVSRSYLASDANIAIESVWKGNRSYVSGEGMRMLRLSGAGEFLLSSYGAIHVKELDAGETYLINAGHLVAAEGGMHMQMRLLGGVKTTMLIGEDLVAELHGPGKIYMQTRSPGTFARWIRQQFTEDEPPSLPR